MRNCTFCGSPCAKKSGKVKCNRWRRELEKYASDNNNKMGSTDAESKEEIVGFITVDSFPVVIPLTIERVALLFVIFARPGVQQHFMEACLSDRKGAKASSICGQLDSSDIHFSCPRGFFYCYPNRILFKPILNYIKCFLTFITPSLLTELVAEVF